MSTQVRTRSAQTTAWVSLLRAHAAVIRQANADLVSRHGLTINDYEVLVRLSRADEKLMRRVDLAAQVLLTPSGITRLLEGLERAGYVEKAECASDKRVTYAKLTEAGEAKLADASASHIAQLKAIFSERFSEDELGTLASLLERLPLSGSETDCEPR